MRLDLTKLRLELRRSVETIDLPRVNYFYGPIGSGKSSIGRLVDYCLGGSSKWTPALQSELVSVALELSVNDTPLTLYRDRDSTRLVATWQPDSRLPPVLVIDTPTKNVSSIENPEVISAFFRLVYELAAGELAQTQFIIIDNEFNPVPPDVELAVQKRHLVKGDPENPPLIPYLAGDFSQDEDGDAEPAEVPF